MNGITSSDSLQAPQLLWGRIRVEMSVYLIIVVVLKSRLFYGIDKVSGHVIYR